MDVVRRVRAVPTWQVDVFDPWVRAERSQGYEYGLDLVTEPAEV